MSWLMTKRIITLISMLRRQASWRARTGRGPHMLLDSRTELPRDKKNPGPTGLETQVRGLDGYLAPSLGAGPKNQNGEAPVSFQCP